MGDHKVRIVQYGTGLRKSIQVKPNGPRLPGVSERDQTETNESQSRRFLPAPVDGTAIPVGVGLSRDFPQRRQRPRSFQFSPDKPVARI